MQTLAPEKTRTRESQFDLLRVIALFFVMVLHIAGGEWNTVPSTGEWLVFHTYDGISRFCVPVFVMLSGKFMLSPEKSYTPRRLFQKILRFATAFLFWSALYALICPALAGEGLGGGSFSTFLKAFVSGNYHMWFLFMIAGLYLLLPILRLIADDRKMTGYFILLSLIFQGGVTLLTALEIPYVSGVVSTAIGKMRLSFVGGYTALFLAGRYLDEAVFTRKQKGLLYGAGALSLVFTVIVSALMSLSAGVPKDALFSYFQPTVFFTAAALFVFAKEHFPKKLPAKAARLLTMTANFSLGMYLCHDIIIKLFHTFLGFDAKSLPAVLSVPAVAVAVFAASFVITALIHRIPILNRYII